MTFTDVLIRHAEPLLALLLAVGANLQKRLGPEDDWVESTRGSILRTCHPVAKRLGRPLVREKGRHDYVCTVDATPEVVETLLASDYSRNLFATKKARRDDDTRQWAVGSWVRTDDVPDGKQHHVYLFDNGDGTTDIYAHLEATITDPDAHDGGDEMVHGDPLGLLVQTLERSDSSVHTLHVP